MASHKSDLNDLLYDFIDTPILIVRERDRLILDANPAAARFYGRTLTLPSPVSLGEIETRYDVAYGPTAERYRGHHRLSDGSEREVDVRTLSFASGDERLLALFITDVTNRLKTEQELHEALKEAEAAGRARSEFLANASHEFRTPVSGIVGIAALLGDSDLSDDQKHLLSLLDGAAKDLERMLRDLLDISRIDVGKVLVKRSPFDIPAMVERAVLPFVSQAGEKGLDLEWFHEGEGKFIGDETRLVQIVANLVSNAVKYTESGGITIGTHCRGNLEISVVDSGIGIQADQKEVIFDMFRQVENPYTKERPGLGLGLAIVRSLVDLMGGTVSVEDNREGGSRFLVTIPHAPEAFQGDGGSRAPAMPRILIVEDDELSRYFLTTILRKRGFDAEDVPDGETALERFDPNRYLAVLMDVGLPLMSGIDVTKEWRLRESDGRRTPIWAVTAHGFQSDRDRCMDAGMDEFFLKPIDEPALTAKLWELVEDVVVE